ncbi:hypothetical protein PG990_012024 [Apiospora arundinis]
MGQVAPNVGEDAGADGHAPGSRCPYFQECGANTEEMNDDQWSRHMETNHAGHGFFPNGQPDPNVSAPPAGYETGSLMDPRSHRPINRQVEPATSAAQPVSDEEAAYWSSIPFTAATSVPVGGHEASFMKKRPHGDGIPAASSSSSAAKNLFDRKQWGTARLDEETDHSMDEGNSNKRRKVSFETGPAHSHHQVTVTEEPEEDLGAALPPQSPTMQRHVPRQPPPSSATHARSGLFPGQGPVNEVRNVEHVDRTKPYRDGKHSKAPPGKEAVAEYTRRLFSDPIKPYANVPPLVDMPLPRADYGNEGPAGAARASASVTTTSGGRTGQSPAASAVPTVVTTTSQAPSSGRATRSPAKSTAPRSPTKSAAPKSPLRRDSTTWPYGASKSASPSGTVPPFPLPESGTATETATGDAVAAVFPTGDDEEDGEPYIASVRKIQPPPPPASATTTTKRYGPMSAKEAGPGHPYIASITQLTPGSAAPPQEEQPQQQYGGEPSPRTAAPPPLTSIEEEQQQQHQQDVGTTTRSGRRTKPTAAKKAASEAVAAKSPTKPATRARSAQVEETPVVPPPTPGGRREGGVACQEGEAAEVNGGVEAGVEEEVDEVDTRDGQESMMTMM